MGHCPALAESRSDAAVGQQAFELAPVRVLSGRDRLAHARHAVAQANVAGIAARIAELGEQSVLPGDDELSRCG